MEESKRLINACQPDFRLLVKAALFTGTRYSELTGMTVGDLNPDTRLVFVRPAKSGKGRHVPLSLEGLAFFVEQTQGRHSGEVLFLKDDGKPWGKNHHIRDLRDTCSAAKVHPRSGFMNSGTPMRACWPKKGVDLLTISKLLVA